MYTAVLVVQEVLQRRWELWRWGAYWLAIGSWRPPSSKLTLLKLHEKLPKNYIPQSFGIWSKLERWKELDKWVPRELTKNFKKITSKCRLLLFYATATHHFSTGLWHAKKSGLHKTGNGQLSGWTEKLQSTSQSQTCTKKKVMVHCWLVCCPSDTAFWIPAKPLHLRSMLNKSMRWIENFNACSPHWSTEWAQFFSKTNPDCTWHNQRFKSWMNWATKFCLFYHIHLTCR